jgi:hypothetical protein
VARIAAGNQTEKVITKESGGLNACPRKATESLWQNCSEEFIDMRFAKLTIAGVVFAGSIFAEGPFTGTWKLRPTPNDKLAERTITEVETAPDVFMDTYQDVARTGERTKRQDSLICDGNEHPVPNEKYTLTCRQINANIRTIIGKQDGKAIQEIRHELSADGKSMTVRNQRTGNATVYDRQ